MVRINELNRTHSFVQMLIDSKRHITTCEGIEILVLRMLLSHAQRLNLNCNHQVKQLWKQQYMPNLSLIKLKV